MRLKDKVILVTASTRGIGHAIVKKCAEEGARVYMAARDLDRAEAFAAQYGFEKAYGSYEALLRDPDVELVYIATPHSHHAEHMKLCIEHGKHVLCEKPLSPSSQETAEILKDASKDLVIGMCHSYRFFANRRDVSSIE